jgi:hypothetical protein
MISPRKFTRALETNQTPERKRRFTEQPQRKRLQEKNAIICLSKQSDIKVHHRSIAPVRNVLVQLAPKVYYHQSQVKSMPNIRISSSSSKIRTSSN